MYKHEDKTYICEDCCGDGLHHSNPDVFEVVEDDPCPTCAGSGVTEEAGNEIDIKKRIGNKACYYEADIDFYMGEGVDDIQELPVWFYARWSEGFPETQTDPYEPAGYEIEDCYFCLNDSWYQFEPTEDQEEDMLKSLGGDDY